MAESRRTGDPLPAVLHRNGLVGEKDLTAAIAETVGLRFVDFTEHPLHPDAATTVPERRRARARRDRRRLRGRQARRRVRRPGRRRRGAGRRRRRPATRSSRRPPAATRSSTRSTRCSARRPHGAPILDEPRRRSRHRGRARGHPRQRAAERCCSSRRARTSTSPPGARRSSACTASCGPSPDIDADQRLADPGDDLRDPHAEAAGEVRERARARLLVHAAGQEPLPGERVPPARLRRRGDAGDPLRDRRRSTSSACPASVQAVRRAARVAWCS